MKCPAEKDHYIPYPLRAGPETGDVREWPWAGLCGGHREVLVPVSLIFCYFFIKKKVNHEKGFVVIGRKTPEEDKRGLA
ncbi:MAG: hypothetical protein R6U03_05765, partial [Gillisia sp.]